jgi:hypothetical protein
LIFFHFKKPFEDCVLGASLAFFASAGSSGRPFPRERGRLRAVRPGPHRLVPLPLRHRAPLVWDSRGPDHARSHFAPSSRHSRRREWATEFSSNQRALRRRRRRQRGGGGGGGGGGIDLQPDPADNGRPSTRPGG